MFESIQKWIRKHRSTDRPAVHLPESKETSGSTSVGKVPCTKCGVMILTTTAERNKGLCAPCAQGGPSPEERERLRREQKQLLPLMSRDLAQLPRWAQVAFAARCSRRAQPALQAAANDIGQAHVRSLDTAISMVERTAATASCHGIDVDLAAENIDTVVEQTGGVKPVTGPLTPLRYANAAALTVRCGIDLLKDQNASQAAAAANLAIAACGFTMSSSSDRLPSVIPLTVRGDYHCLQQLCDTEGWDDRTPVPPGVFGGLWPNGQPEGWPTD